MNEATNRDARAHIPTLLAKINEAAREAKAAHDVGNTARARTELQRAADLARWVDGIYQATEA